LLSDFFLLAFKNLKHRGMRSWLTLLGIFIGVTAVVSLMALGNGLQLAVTSQFGISSTELLTVEASGVLGAGPPGTGAVVPLTTKELDAIKKLSSVERAVKRNFVMGKFEFNDRVIFGSATNIPDKEDRKFIYEQLEAQTIAGRLLKDEDVGKVLLGYNFYENKVGLEKRIIPGNKVIIQEKKYEVVGIIEKKGSFMYDNSVYMNEKDLAEIGNYGNEVDMITVQAKNNKEIEKTKNNVEKVLRKVRDVKQGKENFKVSTPEAQLQEVNSILAGIQAFIVIIASISIFIGAIGIINTMTTSILERKKDIGIMKSFGATNKQIFIQFFIESGLLGLIGGLGGAIFGTIIGFVGTLLINNFVNADVLPKINFFLIFGALIGSFIIGAIAGIIPAMNAAKQNPVDALR